VIRRALLSWLLLIGCLGSAFAAAPEEIFDRGNQAYTENKFEEAVEAYGMLLQYGIEDPRVEYNLGNALFRLGQLGPAILHFERARRLDPTDADIRANLEYARSRRFDIVEAPALPGPVRWLHDLQDRLGPDRQAWGVVVLVWCLVGLLGWTVSAPGRWRAGHGWTLAGMLLMLAILLFSWSATYQRLEGRELAVVLVESAEVLAGPGENNPALFTVHEGLTVEVRDVRNDWVQVSLPNKLNGWLRSGQIGGV